MSSQPRGQFQSKWNREAATSDEGLVVFVNFEELELFENSHVSPPSPHRLPLHAVGQRSRSSLFHSPPGTQIFIRHNIFIWKYRFPFNWLFVIAKDCTGQEQAWSRITRLPVFCIADTGSCALLFSNTHLLESETKLALGDALTALALGLLHPVNIQYQFNSIFYLISKTTQSFFWAVRILFMTSFFLIDFPEHIK